MIEYDDYKGYMYEEAAKNTCCKSNVVENGNYIPKKVDDTDFPRTSWNDEQKLWYLLNSKARNPIMCALTKSEFEKVHSCKSSKEIPHVIALCPSKDLKKLLVKKLLGTLKVHEIELREKKGGSRWKNYLKKFSKGSKDKSHVVCYECFDDHKYSLISPTFESLNVVENGDHIPFHDDGVDFPKSLWNEEQKLRYLLN
ncbi:hypothetical protein CR513_43663, partial [Mucuna pruriens]